ncbi:MAG: cytochrome P450, partial [Polyangiaceae bacterium]
MPSFRAFYDSTQKELAPRFDRFRSTKGMRLPPRAAGLPILGSFFELTRHPPRYAERCARALGDVSDLGMPGGRIVLLAHPDHIENLLIRDNKSFQKDRGTHGLSRVLGNGLLTSEGDFWRRQRRLAQPAFHRERISAYGEVMVAYAERAADRWQPGSTMNLHEDLMHLTMEIVAKALFDADVGESAKDVGRAMEVVTRHFERVRPGAPAFFDRIPTPG